MSTEYRTSIKIDMNSSSPEILAEKESLSKLVWKFNSLNSIASNFAEQSESIPFLPVGELSNIYTKKINNNNLNNININNSPDINNNLNNININNSPDINNNNFNINTKAIPLPPVINNIQQNTQSLKYYDEEITENNAIELNNIKTNTSLTQAQYNHYNYNTAPVLIKPDNNQKYKTVLTWTTISSIVLAGLAFISWNYLDLFGLSSDKNIPQELDPQQDPTQLPSDINNNLNNNINNSPDINNNLNNNSNSVNTENNIIHNNSTSVNTKHNIIHNNSNKIYTASHNNNTYQPKIYTASKPKIHSAPIKLKNLHNNKIIISQYHDIHGDYNPDIDDNNFNPDNFDKNIDISKQYITSQSHKFITEKIYTPDNFPVEISPTMPDPLKDSPPIKQTLNNNPIAPEIHQEKLININNHSQEYYQPVIQKSNPYK